VLHELFRYAGKRTVTSIGGAGNRSGTDLMLALIVGDLVDDLLWGGGAGAQFVAAAGTLRIMAHGEPIAEGMLSGRLVRHAVAALLREEGIGPERWHEVRAG
jgi:hypothetical protein